MTQFVSKPIVPQDGTFDADSMGHGEPGLPTSFDWEGDRLVVAGVRKQWRSLKDDRGDSYVKRYWFEFDTEDGRVAVVYFDRGARRGQPRWWLYTVSSPA